MKPVTLVATAALLAGCGRSQWREVDTRLQEAAAPARAAGMEPLAGRNNEFGAFGGVASARWSLTLDSARAYYLAAVCTEACLGVDLEITLADGSPLGRDSSGGTVAALSFQATAGGAHPVRLRLAGCREGTCRWAAQLYSRP